MTLVGARLYAWGGAVGPGVESAHRTFTDRRGTLLVLEDDEGRVGLGEATPLEGFSVESHEEAERALARVGWAGLAGCTAPDPLHDDWGATLPPSARFALETAMGDLASRRAGLSLSSWLARRAGRMDGAPTGSPLRTVLLGRLSGADLQDRAVRAIERGARSLKAKATYEDPATEARALGRLRALAGPDVELRLDLNGGLGLGDALRAVAHYADLGATSVEEPTRGRTLLELGRAAIPWLADESLTDASLAAALARDRDCGGFVLKPTLLGGLSRVLELARSLGPGRTVVVTHAFEGPVALAAVAEIARALGCSFAGVDPHAALVAFLPISIEQIEDGAGPLAVRACARTGLGIDIDERALRRLGEPRFHWRAARRA